MSKHLKIEEKVNALRTLGYYIEKREGGWLFSSEKKNSDNPAYGAIFGMVHKNDLINDREICRLYKVYLEKGKGWSKQLKKITNDMDRAAQRDLIKMEKFDDIPDGKRVKTEDKWAFD